MIRSCRGNVQGAPSIYSTAPCFHYRIWSGLVGRFMKSTDYTHLLSPVAHWLRGWVGSHTHMWTEVQTFKTFSRVIHHLELVMTKTTAQILYTCANIFVFSKHCVTFNSSFDTAFWLILSFISTKKHVTIVWFIIFVSYFSLLFYIPFHEELIVLRGMENKPDQLSVMSSANSDNDIGKNINF